MMVYKGLLFLFMVIAPSTSQDTRTLELYKIDDARYQCVASACSSSTNVSVSDFGSCQITCLADPNCRTITFDPSNNNCQVFSDSPSQRGNILAQAGVTTMTAIDSRELFTCK